ncbi:MAG: DUF6544 family protein [Bacteroidota bacterium]
MILPQYFILSVLVLLLLVWIITAFFYKRWWVLAVGWSILTLMAVWYFMFMPWVCSAFVFIVLVVALRSKNRLQFYAQIDGELAGLREHQSDGAFEVTQEQLDKLPPLVRKWLDASGVVPGQYTSEVCIGQTGEMKTAEKGNWMPFEAKQNSFVSAPGFLWQVKVRFVRGIKLYGRDLYAKGKGNMLIRLGYLFRVVNSTGPKIDQGTLLRFLGEMVWYPQAAVCSYVSWEDLSENRAKAVMKYGKTEAEGVFHFTEEGQLLKFEALRYMSNKLRPWIIETEPGGYETFGSLRCPARLKVSWMIENTKWTWLKLQVTEIAAAQPTGDKM